MVTYVASRLISGAESSCIFDFAGPGHRSMAGIVNESCVNVYDYSENCQLTGSFSAGKFQLFHQKERVHISLEILGGSFRGYDHSVGRYFNGIVNGSKISVYDDADHARYSYWCESPRYSRVFESGRDEAEMQSDSQALEPGPENPVVG